MDRRGFLLTTGRLVLLGGLTAVSAVSLRKGEPGDDECTLASRYCSKCGLLEECSLPPAVNERAASVRK